MSKQEYLVPALILAGFLVAVAALIGSRYQHANHARLDGWTSVVKMCIPVNEHLICH